MPSDIIQAIIFDEYGLTFKEWQEKGLPFPEEKKEEYFEQVEKNGGKLLPYSLYQNKLTKGQVLTSSLEKAGDEE